MGYQNGNQYQNQYVNPMYGQTGPMAAQNIQNQQQNQYINPMYGQTAPMAAQNIQQQPVQISLGNNEKKDDDDFGGFQSGQSSSHQNVKVS